MQQAPTDEDKLMKAVSNQDVEGIKRFATKDNINKIYNNPNTKRTGFTLLEHAAYHDWADSIKALLEKGADVNFGSALHLAISNSSKSLASIEVLLNAKADVNLPDIHGQTPLHVSISKYHDESVKLLLKAKADIHLRDKKGNTPLHIAAESANNDAAILLKNEGAIFDVTNNAGMKPLALAENKLKTHQARIKRPGDSNPLKTMVNFLKKYTWGYYIIPPADKEVVLASAEFIKIVTSNDDQDTKAKAIKNLLNLGADPNINIETLESKSPILQYFVYKRNLNLGAVGYLLKKGAKVNQGDQDGDTALHILAQDTSPDSETKIAILELLLRNEGDLNKKNNAEKTPLEYALENGQKEIADAIIKYASEHNIKFSDEVNLAIVKKANEANIEFSDEVNLAIVKKANDDLLKVTLSSDTPDNKATAIEDLLNLGADPNIRLEKGNKNPIIQCFVDDGNLEAIKHLLNNKKADVNKKDEVGDTALHVLAQNRTVDSKTKIDILKLLLTNGADLNIKNNAGKTPLENAMGNGQKEIADAMRKYADKANLAIAPSSSPSSPSREGSSYRR